MLAVGNVGVVKRMGEQTMQNFIANGQAADLGW